MCDFISMVETKDRMYWSLDNLTNHNDIVNEFKLNESLNSNGGDIKYCLVKVEKSPPNTNSIVYFLNEEKWHYKFEESCIPEWFREDKSRQLAKETLKIILENIKNGTNPSKISKIYNAAFLYCVKKGFNDTCFLLLDNFNIDINCKDESGFTPLMLAFCHNNLKMATFLAYNSNLDVNARDNCGNTALMLAACYNKDFVKMLLNRNNVDVHVDVNAKAKDNYTALMLAARCEHPDIVECLLEHSAITASPIDMEVKDNEGKTAIDLGLSRQKEIAEKIKKIFKSFGKM